MLGGQNAGVHARHDRRSIDLMTTEAWCQILTILTAFRPHACLADQKLMQRNRAGAREDAAEFDYLRDEIATRLVDRLNDITRTFPVAVDLGANTGNIAKQLSGHCGIKTLHMIEPSEKMLFRNEAEWRGKASDAVAPLECILHNRDVEGSPLPFATGSVDLVMSSCSLHWVNDLPGVFAEVRRILKPDGVFLAAMLGGETLQELRDSFYAAEMQLYGGVSPHASPMAGIADVGNLLSGAGFQIPTVDSDIFTIEYPNPMSVFKHLRAMGESNAALGMRQGCWKRLLNSAADHYTKEYQQHSSDGQGVPATFQTLYMIGWAPAASQPQPSARGSVPKGFGMRKGVTGGLAASSSSVPTGGDAPGGAA